MKWQIMKIRCVCNYLQFLIFADDMCDLNIDDNIRQLSFNQSYASANDPCIVYRCLEGSKIIKINVECNTSCANDEIYRKIPNDTCCGQCTSKFCVDQEGRTFNSGETWKSPDNCTINECIDDGLELRVTSYQKTCSKLQNCPASNIEIRDCCPYCNLRRDSE